MLAACIGGAVVLEGQGPLKIATIAPDNSIYVKALREMAEGWKRRTNGRVTTHIYAGGDMYVTGIASLPFRKAQASGRMVNGIFQPAPPGVYVDANFKLQAIAR